MSKKILVLSPETFHATGGIQNMGRSLVYLLHQLCQKNNWQLLLHNLNDPAAAASTPYLPKAAFRGFGRHKISFSLRSILAGVQADVLIVSHVNLSLPALIIRLLHPACKIWLFAHGTEVWRPLSRWKKRILKTADHIICVSSFTRERLIAIQQADPQRCMVLHNIADPLIQVPAHFDKPDYLLKRYGLKPTDKIVLTLSRMTAHDQAKGYDQVIRAMGKIIRNSPNIRYLLAGKWAPAEKIRIEQLVAENGMDDHFILTGYLEPEELADHYLIADLFVLPSKKEGFGIVFVEAMMFGLPVICGNKDGSTDVVRHVGMGTAIDPDDPAALELAIRKKLHQRLTTASRKSVQQECLKHFNAQQYSDVLLKLIAHDARH